MSRFRLRLTAVTVSLMACAACAASAPSISLELNRLEPRDGGCRMHLVLSNPTATRYSGFQLDLVVFGTDGVVARRVTVDASPLRASKTSVYAFDLADLPCDGFGRVLLNDVTGCATESGPAADCVSSVAVSSRAGVELTR